MSDFDAPPPSTDTSTPTQVGGSGERAGADEVAGIERRAPGRYKVEAELGRGGMGVVYRALDRDLGRRVAMKVIADRRAGERAVVARFVEEARATARLEHPAIVPVHD
ncbi:MAG TPA: serine/threonine protein kinase, partial [Planctomycetota bacterium]|nr:serine/threonine protein kinase [Planctomycetota bacterium]